ncbi:MAG: methyltransferase domain-containing protein [Rhodospirillaceae bacterium]|jgi:SAM-dependent methyltransferase|nr:methyltransferase domain-containing protein [Rhodospirillaceae bacterium]MBT4690934.1 methyltransferase domain-containing protein [Rhodospirillaceae bacterium]MBT5081485.1 methyltransferase domain-containing protein [Rhodospirillaceae bacterium]MBT5526927.1 methyltransferase domain-containing protein [Rhodospirillaceae bacterium]MBT5881823.1 methyltransferase domain-containing protein [Rhodospirillaceae bacterium]
MTHKPNIPCRLCRNENVSTCLHLPRAPRTVERLLRRDQLVGDQACPLDIAVCPFCGFVQLTSYLGDEFYADYEMGCSFSPNYHHYLATLSMDFLAHFDLNGKKLLEVGCGDGAFLDKFSSAGIEVTGIEPSKPFRDAAQARGHYVLDMYLGPDSLPPGAPYDAVVTRQVLEHIFDVDGFLRGLNNCLTPGGVLLVEVPNLALAMSQSRFYDFFPDHVNYFNAATLSAALFAYGFDVVSVAPTMAGEFVTAHARKIAPPPDNPIIEPTEQPPVFAAMTAGMEALIARLRALDVDCIAGGKKLAVWGSGGKGVAALAAADLEGIDYVVDADPRKQGLFMPASHHQVQPPEHLRQFPPDVIVLTALAHRAEILNTLQNEYGFQGIVVALGETLDSNLFS